MDDARLAARDLSAAGQAGRAGEADPDDRDGGMPAGSGQCPTAGDLFWAEPSLNPPAIEVVRLP